MKSVSTSLLALLLQASLIFLSSFDVVSSKLEKVASETDEKECAADKTHIPDYDEEMLKAFGCSTDVLDAWLSPNIVLKGYHVLCISSQARTPSSTSTAGGISPVVKVLAFKQGQPDDTLELGYDLNSFSSYNEMRKFLAQDLMIAREMDPWYDADGFFQLCRNEHEQCQEWTNAGECENNPNYMLTHCGGSCGTCNRTHDNPVWRGRAWEMYEVNSDSHDMVVELEPLKVGGVFTLFEGGAFIWPGVRIGYKRHVLDVGKEGGVILQTASLQPLVVTVENFLSQSECQHVIQEATPYMAKSKVAFMDRDIGKSDEEFRTSSNYFLPSKTHILRVIDERVARVTRVPRQHQEYVQVLRYEYGEHYGSHHDSWDADYYQADEWLSMTQGGFLNRLATVFWYMSDVEEGGETNFPRAHGGADLPNPLEECGNRGLSVSPREGKVIIFYSLKPDGSMDPYSLHASCPVKKGTKWAANKWVWNQPKNFIE